jgi:hypothetical protein
MYRVPLKYVRNWIPASRLSLINNEIQRIRNDNTSIYTYYGGAGENKRQIHMTWDHTISDKSVWCSLLCVDPGVLPIIWEYQPAQKQPVINNHLVIMYNSRYHYQSPVIGQWLNSYDSKHVLVSCEITSPRRIFSWKSIINLPLYFVLFQRSSFHNNTILLK